MSAPIGNKYAVGNNGGRPPIFNTSDELISACDEYFEYIKGEWHFEKVNVKNADSGEIEEKEIKIWDRMPEPATVTGLTLFLGFADRCSLDDYEAKEVFSHIIKKARARVEHEYEKCLYADKPTGAIFALKNMGWKDKTEVDNTHAIVNKEDLQSIADKLNS